MKRRELYKIIVVIILLVITKIFVINPIEERKQLLENEKKELTKNIEEVEKYKKQVAELKETEKIKKNKELFYGRDDVIEVQNTINKIVEIQSIENLMEVDENGKEVSNINIKFVGTYEEIFKVVDAFNSRGISDYIKGISISKVEYMTEQIPDIQEISKESQNTKPIKFECILKISKS